MKIKLEYQSDHEEADLIEWTVLHTLEQLGLAHLHKNTLKVQQTDVSGGNVNESTLLTFELELDIKDFVKDEILKSKNLGTK